jgi:hypothetical protein
MSCQSLSQQESSRSRGEARRGKAIELDNLTYNNENNNSKTLWEDPNQKRNQTLTKMVEQVSGTHTQTRRPAGR